mgnify:CR=1 FL=1
MSRFGLLATDLQVITTNERLSAATGLSQSQSNELHTYAWGSLLVSRYRLIEERLQEEIRRLKGQDNLAVSELQNMKKHIESVRNAALLHFVVNCQ